MRRFYRSRDHKIIAGVCGGIAEKYGISPIWVRLIFIALIAAAGIPIVVVYGVFWKLWPVGPEIPDEN